MQRSMYSVRKAEGLIATKIRKRKRVDLVPFFVVLMGTAAVAPAQAAVVAVVTGGAAVSLTAAEVEIKVGELGLKYFAKKKSWWGKLGSFVSGVLYVKGIVTWIVDPPAGKFFDGSFTIHYPEEFFEVTDSGWLGDWGADPSLSPPPVNPLDWGDGITFEIQSPSSGLLAPDGSSSIVDIPGMLTASFDWGSNGHEIASPGHFNFFAAAAVAKKSIRYEYLGASPNGVPLPGANLFATSSGLNCLPEGDLTIAKCGDETTDYWKVSEVPIPAAGFLFAFAISLFPLVARWKRVA